MQNNQLPTRLLTKTQVELKEKVNNRVKFLLL